jgi:hypothetical protein
MESGFKPEDVKPADNTLLYFVLGLCYSGLFFMIVAGALAAGAAAFGNKMFNTDISYLLAVSFYLGLVLVALIGLMLSYSEPEERKMAAMIRRNRH